MSADDGTMARRRHGLLTDIEQTTAATMLELGFSADIGSHVGAAIADMLVDHWGGQQITFPLNAFYALAEREQVIVARHRDGARIFELAREFRMTERGVRKLLARVGAGRAKIDTTQSDLFDAE